MRCHPWTGHRNKDGYGMIGYGTRPVRAHRVAWILERGEPPANKPHVLHNCPGGDLRACCNIRHLWVGTHNDNMRDMALKGRARTTPLYGAEAGAAKLTEERARFILASPLSGMTLARELGLAPSTIHRIRNGKRWKYLTLGTAKNAE